MRNKTILILLLFFFLVCLSCTKSEDIVATVGKTKITTDDLIDEMNAEKAKYDREYFSNKKNFDAFKRLSLMKIIDEAILLSEAKKLGIKKGDKKKAEMINGSEISKEALKEMLSKLGISEKRWKESQEKRLVIDKLIESEVISKIPISDAEVNAYYRKHISEFYRPAQYRAKQILLGTKEEADAALARIKKGEDFSAVAKDVSQSPDGKNGGDLGYFDANSYPPVFIEICQKLSVGETSDVIPTDYGFQIFRLVDKRPAKQVKQNEATPSIKRLLAEEKSEEAFKKWFEDLKNKSEIKVNEEVLSKVKFEKE